MNEYWEESPCLGCCRVPEPADCENKACKLWQAWFVSRWERLRRYPRLAMDLPGVPMGQPIGGNYYPTPDQLRRHLSQDPCDQCSCGPALCTKPCRARENWAMVKGQVGR